MEKAATGRTKQSFHEGKPEQQQQQHPGARSLSLSSWDRSFSRLWRTCSSSCGGGRWLKSPGDIKNMSGRTGREGWRDGGVGWLKKGGMFCSSGAQVIQLDRQKSQNIRERQPPPPPPAHLDVCVCVWEGRVLLHKRNSQDNWTRTWSLICAVFLDLLCKTRSSRFTRAVNFLLF